MVDFAWYNPGSSEYAELRGAHATDPDEILKQISLGERRIVHANSAETRTKQSDPSISKHLYLNFREYHANIVS